MDIVIIGVLLGGAYALMAMGLQLQYGVAKIMNLANGEMLVAGSFAAFWFFTSAQVSPLLAILVVAPMAFIFNYLDHSIKSVKEVENQLGLPVISSMEQV